MLKKALANRSLKIVALAITLSVIQEPLFLSKKTFIDNTTKKPAYTENVNTDSNKIQKKNIGHLNLDNITELSNLSTKDIKYILEHSPKNKLVDLSESFVLAEQKFKINAIVLIAIICHESAWGNSGRAIKTNNLSGYMAYNSNAPGKTFKTKHDSIFATAELLQNNYLNPNGSSYNGLSIRAVNIDYCLTEDSKETDFNWSKSISKIAQQLQDIYFG